MKKILKYGLILLLLSGAPSNLPAQMDTIIRSLVEGAARNRPPPQQQTRRTQPKETTTKRSVRKFDGTWLSTQTKTNPDGQQLSRTFTMVIKEGKATRTLDFTNASTPEKPFYSNVSELRRRWSFNSIDCTEQGSSLTIQWSAGQLSDFIPKTIPNNVIEGYGAPGAETSVYTLKGEELVRVNDPNGVSYKRAK
ncbi:MAG: hypothetical protein DLM73_00810 [Chthoniobacterales bacterium]|nr:MAG: hypothetical protein DLM73_00810 [Chthoniobacterales bacterium]